MDADSRHLSGPKGSRLPSSPSEHSGEMGETPRGTATAIAGRMR